MPRGRDGAYKGPNLPTRPYKKKEDLPIRPVNPTKNSIVPPTPKAS